MCLNTEDRSDINDLHHIDEQISVSLKKKNDKYHMFFI